MKLQKSRILKRLAAVVLAVVLLFSLASCRNQPSEPADEIVLPEKKVAIMVAPEAQYPEDYRAAKELAAEYPEKVVVKEYSDSRILPGGDPEIMTFSKELAADPEIGAIIYARATEFTPNAISDAKEVNPDIVTVCIEPEDSINRVSELANLVLCIDWAKAAEDIVANAKEQGAKYFVVFSINRHITNNVLLKKANTAFKTACEAQGITYVYENSVDPTYSGGIPASQNYIREAVARLYLNDNIKGTDVALFSTDSAVQSTLVEVANERGLIYVCPSFPTAYNGLGEVYEIAVPEKTADIKSYIKNAKEAVNADTEGKARLSLYKFPMASVLLRGALHAAFDILNGTITAENIAEKAIARVSAAADSKDFSISAYDPALKNTFMAYCAGFETIR